VSPLFVSLAVIAAFLLGLRTGIGIGYRAERRKRDRPPARL
jgi:predicted transporter